jgi:hypothetical protein
VYLEGGFTLTTRYINKIGVFSLGKIFALVYGIIGLILGAFMSLFFLANGSMMGTRGAAIEMMFGAGSVIIIPIFYAVIGFIVGIITAAVFNVVTGFAGGLEIEVE